MTPFLADAIFWVAVVACLVAQVGIIRATRATTHAARTVVPAASHRAATRAEEIAWAVLPVIALVVALVLTWRTLHLHGAVAAPLVGGGTA
jgi:heme/copper-type cytochrome/quinol oxidase subunit 2